MRTFVFCGLFLHIVGILGEVDIRKILRLGKELETILECQDRYNGKKLLDKLAEYNDNLAGVLKHVDEFTVMGKRYYKTLEKLNGPPHLRSVINHNYLEAVMNVTGSEVEGVLNKTRDMWNQIRSVYENRRYEDERTAILVDDFHVVEE
uniref:Prolyl 4-hydroxylase alpha-subunit N-terminal domain-containing protein n=1 Tax=Graphocephala atropunctata TaxID=36148 RepID=A0A1B6L9E7_9HEMI